MGYPSLRAVGRRVRSRLLRCWIHDLPRLLAPLVRGKGVWGSLAFGFVLLLSGLGLPVIPEVELSPPPLKISFPLKDLAPYGVGAGLTLFALGLLGLGARRWAVPRARFWEEMEARGIRVVWDGEARDFRERLHRAIEFRLGLGPTGRLLHAYVPRPEEEESLRFLRERVWGPEKQAFGVVIAGPPVAGKTRTAIELVIRLNPPFVLVWPRGRKEGPSSFPGGVALPVPRAVVLADDLPLRPGGEGSSLPEELTALLSACPGLALIATARRDRIPLDVRGVRVVTLQEMSWDPCLEQLAQEVAQAEGRPLAEVKRRFTGHPGSLVAGLEVFQQLYDQLPEEVGRVLGVQESARRDRLGEIGRRFLQAARALWDLGVRTLTLERVWAVVEKAGGELVAVADRSEVQRALEELAFLWVERGKRLEVARFYEGILTEAILSRDGWWERMVWETLRDRKDAAAFVEIGNAWGEEYSPAYQRNPREALRKAIAAYGEALRFRTPDVAPLDYVRIQNNLGLAYWRLSEHEDPVGSLRKAIAAYGEALCFCKPDVAPLDYAETQNNLGLAYRRLSEHEDAVGNLRKAIVAYGEALRFRTPDVAPLAYARTQHNLGLAYWRLSEHEDAVGNLRKAIVAYGEALRFRTPEGTPLFYAETQREMGLAYRRRAEFQTDLAQRCADLRAAVRAFREALRFRTPEAAPRWHEETRQALEEAEEALRRAGCPGSP